MQFFILESARKMNELAGKDVVVFHQLDRGRNTPNISPFALKLETYMRITKISYQVMK